MKRLLIYASNLTGAGASLAAGHSLVPALVDELTEFEISIVLPDRPGFKAIANSIRANVVFAKPHFGLRNDLERVKELFGGLASIAKRVKADVFLTLGDLPVLGLICPQVVLLHQPLLVYEEDELGGLHSWSKLKRSFLMDYFSHFSSRADLFLVQTPVMANRLRAKFHIEERRIVSIPQPIPNGTNITSPGIHSNQIIDSTSTQTKLLFLAQFYPHKNHYILPSVADELRRRHLAGAVQIFTTVPEETIASNPRLRQLRLYPDVITNIGLLRADEVGGALSSSTGLFLPTVAESYGNIYIEAMTYGKPILTSDRDFARWMCGGSALYFDPFDVTSIVSAIEDLADFRRTVSIQAQAEERLRHLPKDWRETAGQYAEAIRHVAS